jgi:prephenate dehydrogenase
MGRQMRSQQSQRQARVRKFGRVALLGLGLMGGSLGLALRERDLAEQVAGYDAREGAVARARERGAIDEASASLEAAVRGADLVVLATPVLAMAALFEALAPSVEAGAVVTDLGSTKWSVCEWADGLLPHPEHFVGGHPMAGREQSGIEAAESGLFEGSTWCLTPTARTNPEATARVAGLVTRLGAVPHLLDPQTHDRLVAGVSHLPIVAAAALVRSLAETADWDAMSALAAGGFRDATRVASGDPVMARDICLSNAGQLVGRLDAYIRELQRLRAHIAAADSAIERDFADARSAREAWLGRKSQP